MSSDNWLVLRHCHADLLGDIELDEILDALPVEVRQGKRQDLKIHDTLDIRKPNTPAWHRLQRDNKERFDTEIAPLLRQGRQRIAYFGSTFVPLALDLGYRVDSFHDVVPYLSKHDHTPGDNRWRWPSEEPPSSSDARVCTEGMPLRPSPMAGPAIVRVSTAVKISAEDTAAAVQGAVAEVDIDLGGHEGVDALRSKGNVRAVAMEFRQVLDRLGELRPNIDCIHLFAAVPVGLAFLMGAAVNSRMAPRIQTYKFWRTRMPHYEPALLIGESGMTKLDIFFISAVPDGTGAIGTEKELREIVTELRDGEFRDQINVSSVATAVKARQLQKLVRQACANIVHFGAHGEPGGCLVLHGENDTPHRVSATSIKELFGIWNRDRAIKCVLLNACYSAELAQLLVGEPAVVAIAIGTTEAIASTSAIAFARGFYSALADKESLQDAFDAGCVEIRVQGPKGSDADCFRLCLAEEVDPGQSLFSL